MIFRHILPNAIAPVLVAMTLGIPGRHPDRVGAVVPGLGVQPPYATWGNILNDGKDSIEIAWWLTLYPGLAILITVLSYNLLGEGIRDALDPRLRQSRVGGRRVLAACGPLGLTSRARPRHTAPSLGRSGGIGRRARLRGVWGNPWGFESPLRHQSSRATSHRVAQTTGHPIRSASTRWRLVKDVP